MIDIHCHILPAIDDGSQSMEDSLTMARIAANDGTRILFTTPHGLGSAYNVSPAKRDEAREELQRAIDQEGIPLKLAPGMECWATNLTFEQALEQPACFMNTPLGAPRNPELPLLVEMPPTMNLAILPDLLFQAQLKGITLLLAHVERYTAVEKHGDMLMELMEKGMLAQFNASSVRHSIFPGAREKLIRKLMQTFPEQVLLGSDAHSIDNRPPILSCARKAIEKWLGKDGWTLLVEENPRRLLLL